MTYTVISGANKSDFAPIIINDGFTDWRLIEANVYSVVLEAQEPREVGYQPRIRRMSIADLKSILGWGTKTTVVAIISNDTVVVDDDVDAGFMVAEPIWAKPAEDEQTIRADMARMREEMAIARDCDRASSFGRDY